MTEAEYRHECSRAELLGIPKPTWEEFVSTKNEVSTGGNGEEEEKTTTEQAEEAESRREGIRKIGGGLDELNSILSSTQKKLNRFKTVCGSFSNILKLHIGTKREDDDKGDGSSTAQDDSGHGESTEQVKGEGRIMMSDSPQHHTKGNELDKLDSLINKAERAELSLSSQNKQMKKFLN